MAPKHMRSWYSVLQSLLAAESHHSFSCSHAVCKDKYDRRMFPVIFKRGSTANPLSTSSARSALMSRLAALISPEHKVAMRWREMLGGALLSSKMHNCLRVSSASAPTLSQKS